MDLLHRVGEKGARLWTPNEGINQICTDVADKICFNMPKNLGVGVDFGPMKGKSPNRASVVRGMED